MNQALIAWFLKRPRPKFRDAQTKSNTSIAVLLYQNKTMSKCPSVSVRLSDRDRKTPSLALTNMGRGRGKDSIQRHEIDRDSICDGIIGRYY